jgi:hypothetical protein
VEVRVYSFREGVDTKIRPFGPHCWLVCGVLAPSDQPWTRDRVVRRRADTNPYASLLAPTPKEHALVRTAGQQLRVAQADGRLPSRMRAE